MRKFAYLITNQEGRIYEVQGHRLVEVSLNELNDHYLFNLIPQNKIDWDANCFIGEDMRQYLDKVCAILPDFIESNS